MQQYEQTIMNLRNEMNQCHCRDASPIVKKDAEIMTTDCSLQRESSSSSIRTLRQVNVALSEEAHALRRVCAALDQQCRAAVTRAQFKDDLIREMRRQLKQAKAKLKEESFPRNFSKDLVESGDHEFVRQSAHGGDTARVRRATPRRGVHAAMDTPQQPESGSEGRGHRLAAGDDGMSVGSCPRALSILGQQWTRPARRCKGVWVRRGGRGGGGLDSPEDCDQYSCDLGDGEDSVDE
ncbi:hypothetical protein JYU34_002981 [Plutella xylostella]|uniref:Uncharacterized protein n=1 Tax=Plutella xylostella TaxID=51655 RepID=A0ABQ7R3N7_PLUXY|nr:hypothetical protein JYU34_002981 [Plutella xylostella]